MPFETGFYLNIVATLAVLGYMIILYASDFITGRTSALLYDQHRSTSSSFWFYFATFALLLATYFVSWIEIAFHVDESNKLVHGIFHVTTATISNVASACVLAAAFAYMHGQAFDYRKALIGIVLFAWVMFIWDVVFEVGGHTNSLFFTLLEASPRVVMSNVAVVLLGWALFARWGGAVFLYLLLAAGYAVLQLPANLPKELSLNGAPSDLQFVFPLLAIGKVLLTYGFLMLVCSSVQEDIGEKIEIDKGKYWPPKDSIRPRHWMLPKLGGWLGASFVHALILAFVAAALFEALRPLLNFWPFQSH